jgi:hypothetical protein
MTHDEVLRKLRDARAEFDARLDAIPRGALDAPAPGGGHSPKDIVAHVTAYDDLIVQRLRAARRGEITEFDRDRSGWQAFNERTWAEVAALDADRVLARAAEVFAALLGEVGQLSDAELASRVKGTAALDPAWLEGEPPWKLIGVDAFDHYPMHHAALEAAAGSPPAS